MNNMLKNLVIWLVIGLVLMTVFNQFQTRQQAQSPMDYSQFYEEMKAGRITEVMIEGRSLKAKTTDGKTVTSYSPGDPWLVSDMLKYGVKIEAKFQVGEYKILILSATDSSGLERWLTRNSYKIPANASPHTKVDVPSVQFPKPGAPAVDWKLAASESVKPVRYALPDASTAAPEA